MGVARATLAALIAGGFFSYGLIVGHYKVAPFNGIKALKQLLDVETMFAQWLVFPKAVQREFSVSVEVVMLGDSITAGADWESMVPQVEIANLGVAGDTSAGVLNRLDDAINLKPSMVFLMIGINDILRGFPMELVEMHIDLAAKRLMENGIAPVIQSTLYVSDEKLSVKVKALNTIVRAWCAKRSIAYVDLNGVLSPDGVLLPRFTQDGIHLNKEAYRIWGDVIRRYVLSAKHAVR